MDRLAPCLAALLDLFRPCFRRPEPFSLFCAMAAAWIVRLGRRCVSRVWETTGRSASEDRSKAFRPFSEAAWSFDGLGRILLLRLVALVPGSRIFLVVDDTLCHKRGAKVAFGGILLDAVLSSKRHKAFRFGNNWATLGFAFQLPFRPDRFFCADVAWRPCSKKGESKKAGKAKHQTKPALALDLVREVASWLPGQRVVVAGDSACMGKNLLKGLPDSADALGPLRWKAELTLPLPPGSKGRRKKGARLATPEEAPASRRWRWQEVLLRHPKGEKRLKAEVLPECCWHASAGQRPLRAVLLRDPAGERRDEALLRMDAGMGAEEIVLGCMRRWSVEAAYRDAKRMLGFHDPMARSAKSVARAHPTAWFCGGLVVLWHAETGRHERQAERHRPWCKHKTRPAFAGMLACCRLRLWRAWLGSEPSEKERKLDRMLEHVATAA
jgi:hypothetical protein